MSTTEPSTRHLGHIHGLKKSPQWRKNRIGVFNNGRDDTRVSYRFFRHFLCLLDRVLTVHSLFPSEQVIEGDDVPCRKVGLCSKM